MGRPRKIKTENVQNQSKVDQKEEKKPEIVQEMPKTEIQDLPERKLLRVDEVALYFDVTERTVYLWIEHGHLKVEYTPGGQKRITRESLDKCRFKRRTG